MTTTRCVAYTLRRTPPRSLARPPERSRQGLLLILQVERKTPTDKVETTTWPCSVGEAGHSVCGPSRPNSSWCPSWSAGDRRVTGQTRPTAANAIGYTDRRSQQTKCTMQRHRRRRHYYYYYYCCCRQRSDICNFNRQVGRRTTRVEWGWRIAAPLRGAPFPGWREETDRKLVSITIHRVTVGWLAGRLAGWTY